MTRRSEIGVPFQFTPENERRCGVLIGKYEQRRSALLPLLWLVQEQEGMVSQEAANYVAVKLDMPPREVWEAVTFYVMFRRRDMGKYCIQVCTNITCTLMGSDRLLEVIHSELGLKPGEVSKDEQFSLVPVQCLGSCDTGPVVQVNLDYCERVDESVLKTLIQKLKSGTYPVEMFESQGVAE